MHVKKTFSELLAEWAQGANGQLGDKEQKLFTDSMKSQYEAELNPYPLDNKDLPPNEKQKK